MTTHEQSMEAVGNNILVLVVLLAAVLTTVGLLTCVVTHYHHHRQSERQQTTDCSPASARLIWNQPCYNQTSSKNLNKFSSTTVPMLALEANMERERCALRDKQVRLHSVHTDFVLGLPTSVHLPDGEETPYGSSTRLHIRDAEQQSEIYRKCIRAPPNRTIEQSEPKPCRSSSTGLLSLSSTSSHSSNDWPQDVVRSHSMSSRYKAATNIPPVILPPQMSRSHKTSGLAQITMVPCLTDRRTSTSPTNVDQHHHQLHQHLQKHCQHSSGVSALSSSNKDSSSDNTTGTSTSRLPTAATATATATSIVTSAIPTIRQV